MLHFHGTDSASVERRLAEIADDERRNTGIYWRAVLSLLFWPALGVLGMAWGFGMDDSVWGPTIFYSSAALADAGILGTVVWAYRRFEG
jgi:hypothetical protein